MTDPNGRATEDGLRFGRFVVEGELGRGAMGRVYRVLDCNSGAQLALKTIAADVADQVFWLKREFRTLAELQHPNLVQFHELFSSSESTFFTMELIDGDHFDAALRGRALPGEPADFLRLTRAAAQLAEGVGYLHARDKLHRDLKPSNVLVDHDERVVLLDFGLATSFVSAPRDEGLVAGTVAYMAPEVFLRATPAPASDWYSVGVMLYEALTGSLPFEANQTHVLAKQRSRYRPVSELVPGAPPELVELIHGLLRAEPRERPSFEGVTRLLGQSHRPSHVDPARSSGPGQALPFVGRADALEVLERGFTGAIARGPGLLTVEGRSGEGKTGLVSRFLAQVTAEGRALVLRGRCHPSEFLPFNALDGVIDDLSDHLSSLGDAAGTYLGAQHPALCRVFPVLARIAGAPAAEVPQGVSDFELRRAAFHALRDLFRQLAGTQPVVVWIDDLQWGQEDSGRLLLELLRPAAAVPLLFILSFRSDEERAPSSCIGVIEAALGSLDFIDLRADRVLLAPLGAQESRRLAAAVLQARADTPASELAQYTELIARGAQGNAFILMEFARHVASSLEEGDVRFDSSLGRMLERRFERLPDLARRIMSVSAIAGRPLSAELLLGASEADFRGAAMLQVLLKSSLLRATQIAARSSYVVYHDRIREALLEALPRRDQMRCHARLADTLLASSSAKPEHVLEHLLHAEQRERAAPFAHEAALQAAQSLAFERAAELFGLALELGLCGQPEWSVRVRQAEALANAGSGQKAAEAFLAAAEALRGEPAGAPSAHDLRRRALEQYLHSGCLEQGRRVLVELLGGIGVQLPTSRGRALAFCLSKRLWIAVRGRRYRLQPPDAIAPEAAASVDLLWAGATGMSMINHWQSDAINVRLLEAALRLGERSRVLRALGFEAAWESVLGPLLAARSLRTLRECEELVAHGSDPYDHAWVQHSACAVYWFHSRWRECRSRAEQSLARYRGLERGTQWEQAVVQTFRLAALAELGAYEQLLEEIPELLRDAFQRGDTFAATALDGYVVTAWLARDQPERALEISEQVVQPWPRAEVLAVHYHHWITRASALSYLGRQREALDELLEQWPALQSAGYLMLAFIGSHLRFLKARVALGELWTRPEAARVRLLRRLAEAELRCLRGTRTVFATAAADCVRAGLAAHAGARPAAAQHLEAAERRFMELEMGAHEECARLLRSALLQDTALGARATEQLRARGVRQPLRFASFMLGAVG
ncbi:MAG: protein kinase [Deltaproteobacteria bacterium]